MLEGLLLGKDSADRLEVVGCLSCPEFVDVLLLKLGGCASRLTEAALAVLLQLVLANQNRLTVGHEQLKAALGSRAPLLAEIFEEYEEGAHFGKTLPRSVYTLLRVFVTAAELGLLEDEGVVRDTCRRLLVPAA